MDHIPEIEEVEYEETYSPFYPLLILMIAVLLWAGYQVFAVNKQRITLNTEFSSLSQQVVMSQNAKSKLYAVAQDLIQIKDKNANAAAIVREQNIRISDTGSNAPSATAPAK